MVQRDLSKREKLLLQLMGKQPHLTNEDIAGIIGFKYAEYVSTLKKKLEKRGYLTGPVMFPDLGKIFRNRVTRVIAFIMFDTSYEYIKSLLQEIDCWIYFYPLEEDIFNKYLVAFMNSDLEKLNTIFEYLRNEGVIRYYHLFEQIDKWEVINPTFLIGGLEAPIEPDFAHILDEVPIPEIEYGSFTDIPLNKITQTLIMRLWNGHGGCDLTKIIRMEKEFRTDRRKELREMLRKEQREVRRKEIKDELRELKGDLPLSEFREAYQQLAAHGILEKIYYVWPYPQSKCSIFWLWLRCSTVEATKKAIFNFGRNARIFTRVSLVQSSETGEWLGIIYVVGDPFLGGKLMTALDQVPEIEDRKLFPVRSIPASHWESRSIPMEYYDLETKTLHFPYKIFYERVKQRLEEAQ